MEQIIQALAQELGRPAEQIQNVVNLIDEGATIPFIARYRKELHGSMDDQLLRELADRLQYLRSLEQRRQERARFQAEIRSRTAPAAKPATKTKRWTER